MRLFKPLFTLAILASLQTACKKSNTTSSQTPVSSSTGNKPSGVFAASGSTNNTILNHAAVKGVLVRVSWKDIEATEGSFNFTPIDVQINAIKNAGKKYSLAVLAGTVGTPDWLMTVRNAAYINTTFRGAPAKLPLAWDNTALTYLGKLADKLAERYNSDTSLQLFYIPQMTLNGIEGHLNGVLQTDFVTAGYTETKWIDASVQNAKRFANAFTNKTLAFEVHDLFNSTLPASSIINSLWNDNTLNKRVGAAMWWISGNNTYQPNLITVLQNFPGDIYCQVIDRSDNTTSFPGGDYSKVFEQAKKIRARYIEPWDYEFTISTWNSLFTDFNKYCDTLKKY
jgi:Beta-galactosidase